MTVKTNPCPFSGGFYRRNGRYLEVSVPDAVPSGIKVKFETINQIGNWYSYEVEGWEADIVIHNENNELVKYLRDEIEFLRSQNNRLFLLLKEYDE